MFAVILGFHGKQRADLLPSHAANFDAFRAASIAAENSNSRLGRFQKLRQEFDECFIGATLQGRSVNRTFNAPHISPATSSLLARGCTRTGKSTAPFLSCISSTGNLPGAFVLDGRLDFLVQDLRLSPGPVGISQQFARHDHQIRLTRFQNSIGLLRLGNHADRTGCNTRLLSNLFGEFHLVTWPDRNRHPGHNAAAGRIDKVYADGLQSFAQLDALLQLPSFFFPIRGGNANEQRQSCGPNLAHCCYYLENDADAILEAAAEFILPKIAEGRKELVQQIAMGGVNLEHFKSRRESALRRSSKSVHDFANLAGRERTRHGVVLIKRFRARRNRLPSSLFWRQFLPPNHGGFVLPFRPECASCMPGAAPCLRTNSARGRHAST